MSYNGLYSQANKLAEQIRAEALQGSTKKPSRGKGLLERQIQQSQLEETPQEGLSKSIAERIAFIRAQTEDYMEGLSASSLATDPLNMPTGTSNAQGGLGGTRPVARGSMPKSEDFEAAVDSLTSKYGFTRNELFATIQGESGGNPQAQNGDTKAAGLFQFIPSSAKMLGTTVEAIKNMSAAEQVALYDKYLEKWGYQKGVPLAMMQAAPAVAKMSDDKVVYKKGSKAWEVNPGWRPSNGGDITVGSIKAYYAKHA